MVILVGKHCSRDKHTCPQTFMCHKHPLTFYKATYKQSLKTGFSCHITIQRFSQNDHASHCAKGYSLGLLCSIDRNEEITEEMVNNETGKVYVSLHQSFPHFLLFAVQFHPSISWLEWRGPSSMFQV